MHHFLPLQRLPANASGHYHTQGSGQGSGAEPHPAPAARSFPAESGHDSARMGRGSESAACGSGASVPGSGAGGASLVPDGAASRTGGRAAKAAKAGSLTLIRIYKIFVSPALIPACRYWPTCSAYAYEAIEKWGVRRGGWMALRRLLRCHPFGGHGYDPVP